MLVGAVPVYLFTYSLQQPRGVLVAAVMVLAAAKKSACLYILKKEIVEYSWWNRSSTSKEDLVCKQPSL